MANTNNEYSLDPRSQAELRDMLISLYQEFQPPEEWFMWPIESMRWNELVYCILEFWSSELQAQATVNAMSELDLLDVGKLANLSKDFAEFKTSERGRLILGILSEAGFKNDAAEQALKNLNEAAKIIWQKFNGQVQRILRSESEVMIQNIAGSFNLSNLDDSSVRKIITRWLQNVLNLPVYLETEATSIFCNEMSITPDELINAADSLDINLGIVDELLQQWYISKKAVSSSSTELLGLEPELLATDQPGDQE